MNRPPLISRAFVGLRFGCRRVGLRSDRHRPEVRIIHAIGLMALRQHVAVAEQLGGEVARPARDIPAIARVHHRRFLEQDAVAVIGQQCIETVERILDFGIHRDHQVARIRRSHIVHACFQWIGLQHQFNPGLLERRAQAVAGLARTRQQDGA